MSLRQKMLINLAFDKMGRGEQFGKIIINMDTGSQDL